MYQVHKLFVIIFTIKCNKNLPPFYKNVTPAEAQKLSK